MRFKIGRYKSLLIIAVVSLIITGLSFAMAAAEEFKNSDLAYGSLMELVPDECGVLDASPDVLAGVEFQRDKHGKIINRTDINLVAANIYAGAHAEFRITAQNISDLNLSVDRYKLAYEADEYSLADLIYFSGAVKILRYGEQYYDELGSFKSVALTELDDSLTAIFKYREIKPGEKIVLELNQQFDNEQAKFAGRTNLTYKLMPVFVQYFPKSDQTTESE